MAKTFIINKKEVNEGRLKNLAKGFGLPLVKSLAYDVPAIPQGDTPDGYSKFGTPYYDIVIFELPSWVEYKYDEASKKFKPYTRTIGGNSDVVETGQGGQIQTTSLKIDGCIIDVSQSRNVVLTNIVGQDGSVKEFINNGDYNITIRGYFDSGVPDKYPKFEVTALAEMLKAPVSIPVHSNFLNLFGISEVVFTNYNLFQQTGMRNIQYFELNALSELPFQIQAQTQ